LGQSELQTGLSPWGKVNIVGGDVDVDSGNACVDDSALVRVIVDRQTPLTLCPTTDPRLKVFPIMDAQPPRKLLDQGVRVTINSDDPSHFGGIHQRQFQSLRGDLGARQLVMDP
jgi:adenosine deaminase